MATSEKAMLDADPKDERIRHINNAIEFALNIGDFQKEVNSECTPDKVAKETIKRIDSIINFNSSAIYLVDEQTSDLTISAFTPANKKASLKTEVEFMIDNGFVAWALRERRGVMLKSQDSSHTVLLHVMATYSRIRGLFIGIFPSHISRLHDASLEMVSIILRNASNGIESLIYSLMMRKQQQELEIEVRRKTRQLVHYEKQLIQAQNMEAIAALAGGVAHKFNNALQVLMGRIGLISMLAQDKPEILTQIERSHLSIKQMTDLTNQLTAYARGGTFVTSQALSVNALFNEILPAIKRSIKETVDVKVEVADGSVKVNVDTIQMQTVILSIITNAVEAIVNEGYIRISSQVVQWSEMPENIQVEVTPGDYVCIGFKDNGIGMDSDTLRRLFEPFYSTKFEGRGLGMAAVSGIIRQHKGFIHVASKSSEGTNVLIYLPKVS